MRIILFGVTAAAALAGCTHLETSRDYGSGSLDQAVPGIPYALPAVQFNLDIVHSVATCPQTHSLAAPGGTFEFSDNGLQIATKVESHPEYVAGEQYLADYRSLSSFIKTSAYGLETYPNGVLKSLNASAEDQTANLIKDVVSVGLSIAKLSTGMPVAGVGATALGESNVFKLNVVGQLPPPPAPPTPPPLMSDLASAIAVLREEAGSSNYLACRSSIRRDQDELLAQTQLLKTAARDLAAANALVSRLTLIAASEHADHGDLVKLEAALAAQVVNEIAVTALLAKVVGGTKALIVTDDQVLRIKDQAVAIAPLDLSTFDRLLVIQRGPVVSSNHFADWWLRLSPDVRSAFRASFPTVAKAYGVTERDPDADRWKGSKPIHCPGQSVSRCVRDAITIHATLTPTDRTESAPDGARLVRPTTKATSPGLFIRSQRRADLRLCVGHHSVETCPGDKLLLVERELAAPQLGQLRFLPFSNRMFESSKLSLVLRENGSIEKFDYGVTKSMSSGSAAVKDAIDQYSKFRDDQEAEAKTSLAAQRAEQVAVLDQAIALKTKQQTLDKLDEPTPENPLAVIQAQIAAGKAEVELLNTQLAKKTAEAALLGSGG